MTLIERDINMTRLQERTWDCDEFWDVIVEQKLDDALEDYLSSCYPEGIELGALNDLLRYSGDEVLAALGADFHGTIWEDQYCKPEDSEGVEIDPGDTIEHDGGEWTVDRIDDCNHIVIVDDYGNEKEIDPKDCYVVIPECVKSEEA